MAKKSVQRSSDATRDAGGLDLLRELAGYPHRSVVMGKSQVNSRITLIQRDHLNRVVGSTERIEETEITNIDGQWTE